MKALVKTQSGVGHLRLCDIQKPAPLANEVLVKVKAAGICGTDLHIKKDTFINFPPVTLGHEFSGEIVSVGEAVTGFQKGDRIVSQPHKGGCGHCRYCKNGQVEICPDKKAIGYKIDGCFSEFICMPATSLHRIPDSLSFEEAALAEPLAVGVKAVLERSKVEPNDVVVVLGCGAIGLLAAAAAKASGARKVLVTGTDNDLDVRLRIAKEMGMDDAISVQQVDIKQKVAEWTHGLGADLVVEASGAPAAIHQAFDLVRRDGRICAIGLTGKDSVPVPWNLAMHNSVTLSCSYSTSWTSWETAIDLLDSKRVNVAPLMSGTYSLQDFESAFQQLENLQAVKNLFVF
ncbi:zinc-dependent alcohol dehydrogenase [Vibrio penaeicida]|uniref:zinc-dependent alcohol dehydrogenase n=1 Tax=Vibrio penaeicida TaxID=104609 RepID=UPI000CE9EE8C|nr:alcohol dehydrogenase catalytic domain-containing protein [Vibrio penaeicida]